LDADGNGVIDEREFALFDKKVLLPADKDTSGNPMRLLSDLNELAGNPMGLLSDLNELAADSKHQTAAPSKKQVPAVMNGFLLKKQRNGWAHRYVEVIPNDGLTPGKLCYRKSAYDNSKITQISFKKATVALIAPNRHKEGKPGMALYGKDREKRSKLELTAGKK